MMKNQKLHGRIESLVEGTIVNDSWNIFRDPFVGILGGVPVSFFQTVRGINDHQIDGSRTWKMALQKGF